ncbi:phage holin family protein [Coleofasciculus sp.]|uniref:phage holin family protein n=1 Tax=Coleofasciculus sp. TaxID=3100458 RepID=UPI003A29E237
MDIIVAWIVTTIAFLIISWLPLGVEIDTLGKAFIAAAIFGILNAILKPILGVLTFPLIVLTFGLFLFVLNAFIFWLAAKIVPGFRLRWGFWSAIIGALALSVINSILLALID